MARPRALPLLAVAYAATFASAGLQLPFTSMAMQRVGFSMSAVGLMWAARSALGILGPALWGTLADRRGDARPFAAASLACGAVLLLALSFATTVPAAVLIFGLVGLLAGPAGSLLDGLTITALGDRRERFGSWRAVGTVGFGVSSFAAAMLIDRQWLDPLPQRVFPLAAALLVIAAFVALALPPLSRPRLGDTRVLLRHFASRDMIGLFLTATLLWCSHVGYSAFLAPLALDAGMPEWAIGASLFGAIVVETVVLRSSWVALGRFRGRSLMIGVAALAAARWGALAMTSSPLVFVALHALHGITFGLFFATLVDMIATRAPPELRQAAQGAIGSSAFGVGGVLGSLIVGNALDRVGPRGTWLVMAAVAVLALLMAVFSLRREPPDPAL
ncbi:MAG: MFS transporter [Deltaproteobacteria bacterium]|nr:MFS transporter [Deltaproteobacteria bacterium]